MSIKDLAGQHFGTLTVIGRTQRPRGIKSHSTYWLLKCDCGIYTVYDTHRILHGKAKCDCQKRTHNRKARKQDWDCPIPEESCIRQAQGLCCRNCERYVDCPKACRNWPEYCCY